MRIPHITSALLELKPNTEWTLRGDTYADLEWLDKNQTKPTEQEIEEKLAELKYQEEINVYQEKRKLEYPNWEDQLDKIYHSGIDAWKADIKVIKDKYPKQTMDANELQKRKDAAIFNVQKRNYEKAVARLAQYELSAGLKGVVGTENVWDDKSESYIDRDVIGYVIEPLPIEVDGERNPLIVQDEMEREAAQEVINNTPQEVINSVSS
jgi:hypothetical protein